MLQSPASGSSLPASAKAKVTDRYLHPLGPFLHILAICLKKIGGTRRPWTTICLPYAPVMFAKGVPTLAPVRRKETLLGPSVGLTTLVGNYKTLGQAFLHLLLIASEFMVYSRPLAVSGNAMPL